jgi:hypothetical protein
MIFWVVVGSLLAVSGLFVLVVTWRHFGLFGNHSIAKPSGLLMILGVGLLLGGGVTVLAQLKEHETRIEDQKLLENKLEEMLGRKPDRLELEGDNLHSFRGTAFYGTKRYKIETQYRTESGKEQVFRVVATPLDD